MLNQTNQTKNELSENQFVDQKTGLTYEKVTINLPSSIVDFYRMIAHFNNKTGLETDLIAGDIIEKLNADLEGMTPVDFKETLNLTETMQKLAPP
jgi:hypothetical protein